MFDNKTARDIGYEDNKDVVIKRINGIYIEKFRTLSDKYIPIGTNTYIWEKWNNENIDFRVNSTSFL